MSSSLEDTSYLKYLLLDNKVLHHFVHLLQKELANIAMEDTKKEAII